MNDSIDLAESTAAAAAALCEAIKTGAGVITLAEGRAIHSCIKEAEGWLESCRGLLSPPGML